MCCHWSLDRCQAGIGRHWRRRSWQVGVEARRRTRRRLSAFCAVLQTWGDDKMRKGPRQRGQIRRPPIPSSRLPASAPTLAISRYQLAGRANQLRSRSGRRSCLCGHSPADAPQARMESATSDLPLNFTITSVKHPPALTSRPAEPVAVMHSSRHTRQARPARLSSSVGDGQLGSQLRFRIFL